jgi:MioC protein
MIQILTGSTLGGAEYVADYIAEKLDDIGAKYQIHNTPKLEEIEKSGIWVIVTSTHGAGEFPDNIKPFFADLAMTPPNMKDVKFCVLAIGDSSYDTFCAAGHQAFEAMLDIGTTPLFDLTCIDILANPVPEDATDPFISSLISSI